MDERVIKIPVVDTSKDGTGEIVDEIVIIPQYDNANSVKLNSDELNEVIQEHLQFFQEDSYELLLSANERIATCEKYLREKRGQFSEIDIITHFAVIAMLFDALKNSYNLIWSINHPGVKNDDVNGFIKTDKRVFCQTTENIKEIVKKACGKDAKDEDAKYRDDYVIKFLRSLIFAHTSETTQAAFLNKANKTVFYSPFAFSYEKSIVLRMYFNGEMEDLYIPSSEMEGYVDFLIDKILKLTAEVKKEAEKDK